MIGTKMTKTVLPCINVPQLNGETDSNRLPKIGKDRTTIGLVRSGCRMVKDGGATMERMVSGYMRMSGMITTTLAPTHNTKHEQPPTIGVDKRIMTKEKDEETKEEKAAPKIGEEKAAHKTGQTKAALRIGQIKEEKVVPQIGLDRATKEERVPPKIGQETTVAPFWTPQPRRRLDLKTGKTNPSRLRRRKRVKDSCTPMFIYLTRFRKNLLSECSATETSLGRRFVPMVSTSDPLSFFGISWHD